MPFSSPLERVLIHALRILLAMELGDHAEAGGAAFHGVGLLDMGEAHNLIPSSILYTFFRSFIAFDLFLRNV